MLTLHPSRETVYAVTKAIPDPVYPGKMLAEPGDELVVRVMDERYPLTVLRHLPIETVAVIPDASVDLLASYELSADGAAIHQPSDVLDEPKLRLLPRVG